MVPKVNFAVAMDQRKEQARDNCMDVDKLFNNMFRLPTDKEGITVLPLDQLRHYPKDPFKDRQGSEMERLAASIRENGLQNPIIVRPIKEEPGQFEILAGRRRVNAIRSNGGTEIDAIIRDVDDDTAAMIVTETNLRSREKIYPSEKAFAYKLQLEAIKHQGKRVDLDDSTCAPIGHKRSRDIIAGINDVSKNEISRFIRLTNLSQPLLDLADEEKIPLFAAIDLSYLDEAAQNAVHAFFFENEYGVKLDLKLSAKLREVFKAKGCLTEEDIEALCLEKQERAVPRTFSINRKKLSPYLEKLPDDAELERLFLEFLMQRFGNNEQTA